MIEPFKERRFQTHTFSLSCSVTNEWRTLIVKCCVLRLATCCLRSIVSTSERVPGLFVDGWTYSFLAMKALAVPS